MISIDYQQFPNCLIFVVNSPFTRKTGFLFVTASWSIKALIALELIHSWDEFFFLELAMTAGNNSFFEKALITLIKHLMNFIATPFVKPYFVYPWDTFFLFFIRSIFLETLSREEKIFIIMFYPHYTALWLKHNSWKTTKLTQYCFSELHENSVPAS